MTNLSDRDIYRLRWSDVCEVQPTTLTKAPTILNEKLARDAIKLASALSLAPTHVRALSHDWMPWAYCDILDQEG